MTLLSGVLDVYVGEVADAALPNQPATGTATNDQNSKDITTSEISVAYTDGTTGTIAAGTVIPGLIDTPRGDVYITGKTVDQLGFINSSTSVSYNGRVDLVAAFNAVPNPYFGNSQVTNAVLQNLPFVFRSNVGNDPIGGAQLQNTGLVTMGQNSVLQILPDTSSTDRVVGDLALPSQVNIQGQSVAFATNSILLAPGAAVPPSKPAFGIDGTALTAGVTISAGNWFLDSIQDYNFVHSADSQQIVLENEAVIDVEG